MNMIRKLIPLFLSVLLIFNLVSLENVFGQADVTPPIFESVFLEKEVVSLGDTVKVIIKAQDDVAIESISLRYITPITGNTLFLRTEYNPEKNQYEGYLDITSYIEPGKYEISSAYIRDTANNITWLNPDELSDGEFSVINNGETTPLLESLTVNKKDALPGDTVKIIVKVSDGTISNDVDVSYIRPQSGDILFVSLQYNHLTKEYEGYIPITTLTESGTYYINTLDIWDNYNNVSRVIAGNDAQTKIAEGSFTVSGSTGSPSQLVESITVDKAAATMGDTQKIIVKLTSHEGIQSINLHYDKPITNNNFSTNLYYNDQTQSFESVIPIDNTLELGLYKVSYMDIRDQSNITMRVPNGQETNLDNGNFTIFTEQNPPVFNRLSIDKTKADSGDILTFTVKATDDTNLQSAKVNLISPISKTKHTVNLSYYNSEFIGKLSINSNTEVGKWIVDSVEITDTNANTLNLNATESDLTSGEFTVLRSILPIDSYVVTSNETWSNKTVNNDVYIAPGAVLTISSNVTIKGNVYVLGGLKVNGGLTVNGSLYANYMTFGYYYPSDGQAILSGSNSVSSIKVSNRILTEVPFKLYDAPLVSKNGKVNITGATLPFVKVSVNGQEMALKSNGSYRLEDFAAGENIKFTITDPYGYEYSYSYSVAEVYVDELTKLSTEATGKTHPNSLVKIKNIGNLVGSGNSDEQGNFSIPVSNLTENNKLTFEVYDSENVLTASKEVIVKDLTAPEQPVTDEFSDNSTAITGKAEADSTVYVKKGTETLAQGTTDSTGNFSLIIEKQKAGAELTIYAQDASGNKSDALTVTVLDKTAPDKPSVSEVSDLSTSISGLAEANSLVFIKNTDSFLAQVTANENGEFSADIEKQAAGTELSISAEDKAGNKSDSLITKVIDKTPAEMSMVEEITDKSTSVSGIAEPGSTVLIQSRSTILAQGQADNSGEFSFVIEAPTAGTELTIYTVDASGNKSNEVKMTVLDKTAPEKPSVNEVTSLSQSITGNAEPGTTITVTADGVVLGTTTADSAGNFTIAINQQKAGTILDITTADKAGNTSAALEVIVTNSFTDVLQNQRFNEEIKFLSDKHIITGFPDGTFRPSDTVTRAQAAIMIGRALGLEGTQRETTFKDVHQSQVASGFIASAVEKGIIAGFPDNSYRPNDPVTRGQMAIFIARAFDLKEESESSFSDVPASSAAYVYIKRILAESITTGYPDGSFKPSKELIRSDFSAFMARALDDRFKISQ